MTRFRNRVEAALSLIPHLEKYREEKGVVLAVPRGGVPIGHPIAKKYRFPLELLMTKKIGHPYQPELAIGAVSLEDHMVDESYDVDHSYINTEIRKIRGALEESYKKFMGEHKPVDLEGKIVIIVDDGVATGNTILSSIKMLRKRKPKKIVVAIPVAPPSAIEKIEKEVDDLICLYSPEHFIGVGIHYMDFTQVDDKEVTRLLRDANQYVNALE